MLMGLLIMDQLLFTVRRKNYRLGVNSINLIIKIRYTIIILNDIVLVVNIHKLLKKG